MSINIKLVDIYRWRDDHWMSPYGTHSTKEIGYSRVIECPNIESVRFSHTDVRRGFFSDTATSYDAVKYGERIYKLTYDIKDKEWLGERIEYLGCQGPHYVDFEKKIREKFGEPDFVRSVA